jgi:hypothetical protein
METNQMKQYIITIIDTQTGIGSIEVTRSYERVCSILDNISETERCFINKCTDELMIEEGRRLYENN